METQYDRLILETIEKLQRECPELTAMPPENRKNAYMQACWLLSTLQRLDKNVRGQNNGIVPELREAIKYLKEALPNIRQAVQNSERS